MARGAGLGDPPSVNTVVEGFIRTRLGRIGYARGQRLWQKRLKQRAFLFRTVWTRLRKEAPPDYGELRQTTDAASLTVIDCGRYAATERFFPVPAASGVAESTRRSFCASSAVAGPSPLARRRLAARAWRGLPFAPPVRSAAHASADSAIPFESRTPGWQRRDAKA